MRSWAGSALGSEALAFPSRDLPPDSLDARICSYECTFCASCADQVLRNVCPNCGGALVPRPIRPKSPNRSM
ncbi:MAG TPA: DUF1272 domain-containing protein [Burkholderiaceae bacterium]